MLEKMGLDSAEQQIESWVGGQVSKSRPFTAGICHQHIRIQHINSMLKASPVPVVHLWPFCTKQGGCKKVLQTSDILEWA